MHIATALKTTKVCTTATFRGFRAFPPLIRKELFFRSSENQRQIPEDGLAPLAWDHEAFMHDLLEALDENGAN